MSTKLKLINKIVEILPQDDTTTYPRLNFNLSNGTYAVPVSATDPNDGNTAASFHFGNYRFYIPTYAFKTITLAGTTNQTITLIYTEPGKLPITVTSTSIDQEFKVQYGTTWTATVTGTEGYNPGTLSASSGTVTAATTVSATAATAMTTITLTNSNYKMSQIYPDTYEVTMATIPNILNTTNLTTMSEMFAYCQVLTSIPQLNTSKVTDMSSMFKACLKLTSIPQLDTSNVTNMSSMFERCYKLTGNENIFKNFNTSKVTNMSYMFRSCEFTGNEDILKNLNTNNVTNMSMMFNDCTNLTTIPLLNTSKVTDMSNMFMRCTKLTTIPQFDLSKTNNMFAMFSGCTKLTTIPQLNTSNIFTMSRMFENCTSLPTTFPWAIDCKGMTYQGYMQDMFKGSSVTKVTLKNVNSSIKSKITSQILKGNNTLTITFA